MPVVPIPGCCWRRHRFCCSSSCCCCRCLRVFPGDVAAWLLQPVLFLKALIGLIVIPLLLAGLVQWWAGRSRFGQHVERMLGVVPVPATALVLFVVVAAVMPRLEAALPVAIRAVPF